MKTYDLSILIPARLSFFAGIITSRAVASTTWGCSKWMPVFTLSFPGIFSGDSFASEYVNFLGYHFKMIRVATSRIATKMVNLVELSIWYTLWDWLDEISIHQPMNTLRPTFIPQQTISLIILTALPNPALTKLNFSDNTLEYFWRQFFNFKHTRSIL